MSHGDEHEERETVSPTPEDDGGQRVDPTRLERPDQGVPQGAGSDEAATDEDSDGKQIVSPGSDGDEEEIDAELVETAVAAAVAAISMQRSEAYSGLLPHPDHWDKFDTSTQERIIKMSEAFTTDESGRRDRLVDAEIAEAPRGRRNALLIMILCLVGAGISIFAFNNTVGAGIFLAVPIATVVRDFIRGRNSGKD